MTEETFWAIIEDSRKGFSPKRWDGNQEKQRKALEKLLRKLGPDELGQFEGMFLKFKGRAYHYDLWACAFLSEGGCGDDAFMDFRSWMVSMGESAYTAMIADADNVADYCDQPGIECIFFERIGYVANDIYSDAFDPDGIPDHYHEGVEHRTDAHGMPIPAGKDWDRDDLEFFRTRFPKMWTKRCRISWPD